MRIPAPGYIVGVWGIERATSDISFAVRYMMINRLHGKFTRFDGRIVTASDPLASEVRAEVDLSSITTGNEQRDEHLRAAPFFEGSKMAYRSISVQPKDDHVALQGNLTIGGITKPLSLEVRVIGFDAGPPGRARARFTATGEMNRKDFGMNWSSTIEGGGVLVGDVVSIKLRIVAVLCDGALRPGPGQSPDGVL